MDHDDLFTQCGNPSETTALECRARSVINSVLMTKIELFKPDATLRCTMD